ncbi:MAG: hypothetical protein WKG01_12130 [Kofleriaceae bacterium]
MIAIVLSIAAAAALGYASVSKKWLYNPVTIGTAEQVGFGPRGLFKCNLRNVKLREEMQLTGCIDEETFVKAGATCDKNCLSMSNSTLIAVWEKELAGARTYAREHPADSDAVAVAHKLETTYHTSSAFPMFGWVAMIACLIAAVSLFVGALLVIANKRIAWPVMPTTTALLSLIVGLVAGPVFVALKPGPPGFVGVSHGFFAFGGGLVVGLAAALMINKLLRPHDADLLEGAMHPDEFV